MAYGQDRVDPAPLTPIQEDKSAWQPLPFPVTLGQAERHWVQFWQKGWDIDMLTMS
jgi:hypothetical protein